MKKTITLLFCIGFFTVSFAQGGKRSYSNNQGNQVAQSHGNNKYNNNARGNQYSTGSYGSYNQEAQRSNGYDGNRRNEYRNERSYHYGYRNRSYDNRWNHDENGNRYRRHRGFLWFR